MEFAEFDIPLVTSKEKRHLYRLLKNATSWILKARFAFSTAVRSGQKMKFEELTQMVKGAARL